METKYPVKIRFVYPRYPDGSREVLAVFIGHTRFKRDHHTRPAYRVRDCYAHIGQHSECCESFARRKRATPEQYAPLLKEMESIGYQVTVV